MRLALISLALLTALGSARAELASRTSSILTSPIPLIAQAQLSSASGSFVTLQLDSAIDSSFLLDPDGIPDPLCLSADGCPTRIHARLAAPGCALASLSRSLSPWSDRPDDSTALVERSAEARVCLPGFGPAEATLLDFHGATVRLRLRARSALFD